MNIIKQMKFLKDNGFTTYLEDEIDGVYYRATYYFCNDGFPMWSCTYFKEQDGDMHEFLHCTKDKRFFPDKNDIREMVKSLEMFAFEKENLDED